MDLIGPVATLSCLHFPANRPNHLRKPYFSPNLYMTKQPVVVGSRAHRLAVAAV